MAARGINKAIIVGTVGQDPELRYAANGSAVVNVSVATNESWNDKNTGEKSERTEWHRIVMFGKLGEIAAQYLKKGSQAYFEGKIHTRKWQDNEGKDRYSTEITANEMQMLGSKGDSGSTGRSAPPSLLRCRRLAVMRAAMTSTMTFLAYRFSVIIGGIGAERRLYPLSIEPKKEARND